MKRSWVLGILLLLGLSACDADEDSCKDGTRLCDGNLSRTCVMGEWREVYCQNAAPICDVKYGCRKADPLTGCGNGKIDAGEECDGAELGGKMCRDVNAALTGTPVCVNCRLDYTGCEVSECRNGDFRCRETVLEICTDQAWKEIMDCSELGGVCSSEEHKCTAEQ